MAIADVSGAVRLWHVADRSDARPLRPTLALPSRVNTVAFSPDGMTLAAGSNDATVRLWTMTDPAKPTLVGQLTGAAAWINAITFSADGKFLAAAGGSAGVEVWDLGSKQVRLYLPHVEPATAVAFREHDQVLYTNSADGVARRWLVPGPVLASVHHSITGLAIHPDRPLLFDGGSDLQLWDLADWDRPTAVGPPLTPHRTPM